MLTVQSHHNLGCHFNLRRIFFLSKRHLLLSAQLFASVNIRVMHRKLGTLCQHSSPSELSQSLSRFWVQRLCTPACHLPLTLLSANSVYVYSKSRVVYIDTYEITLSRAIVHNRHPKRHRPGIYIYIVTSSWRLTTCAFQSRGEKCVRNSSRRCVRGQYNVGVKSPRSQLLNALPNPS